MEPQIRFCTSADGVRIAYEVRGKGTPLLLVPGWVSHLELNVADPGYRSFVEELAAGGHHQIITFDSRGTGLSDREVEDISVTARVRDIEAVADRLELKPFVLFAWSMNGPPSIIYAAQNADRVSHLILYASFARPFARGREDACRALLALMRAEWSVGSKTVVEFSDPGVGREQAESTAQFFRLAAPVGAATRIMEEGMFEADVTQHLPNLTMPTLVMHRREDNAVWFEHGRELAALIPNSRFVSLPGNAHPPFGGDSQPLLQAIDGFLSEGRSYEPTAAAPAAGAFRTVLFTDVEGSTALTQRLGDEAARELLREHERLTREALKSHGGSEVKTMGDGFMASFASATKALECAMAIQRALEKWNRDVGAHGHAPLQVRIGLNAGEPVAEEGDLFGTAVNLAARIAAQAQSGEILTSDVVRQLVAGKGFAFADRGEAALRGFEDPVRLYGVRWRGGEE